MEKLTSERRNGIKTGYWSPKTKEEVVQKLGTIEHSAGVLIDEMCEVCDGALIESIPGSREKACLRCPATKLAGLIGIDCP